MLSELRKSIRLLILESLESQNNIEAFALDILRESARLTLIYDLLTADDGQKYIRNLTSISTKGLPRKKYSKKFQKFIEQSNLQVIFKKNMSGSMGKRSSTLGQYQSPNIIFLNLKDDFINSTNKKIKEIPTFDKLDLFTSLYYAFESTLIHEIQHAYDDWVSKGKYMENIKSNQFQKDINQHFRHANEEASEEKYNAVFNNYTFLPHEINARFTQAFKKIRKYSLNKGDNSNMIMIKKSFEEFKKDLALEFEHWYQMGDGVKKRLIKRLYLMWQQLPETKKIK